jgi:hypothetical protein
MQFALIRFCLILMLVGFRANRTFAGTPKDGTIFGAQYGSQTHLFEVNQNGSGLHEFTQVPVDFKQIVVFPQAGSSPLVMGIDSRVGQVFGLHMGTQKHLAIQVNQLAWYDEQHAVIQDNSQAIWLLGTDFSLQTPTWATWMMAQNLGTLKKIRRTSGHLAILQSSPRVAVIETDHGTPHFYYQRYLGGLTISGFSVQSVEDLLPAEKGIWVRARLRDIKANTTADHFVFLSYQNASPHRSRALAAPNDREMLHTEGDRLIFSDQESVYSLGPTDTDPVNESNLFFRGQRLFPASAFYPPTISLVGTDYDRLTGGKASSAVAATGETITTFLRAHLGVRWFDYNGMLVCEASELARLSRDSSHFAAVVLNGLPTQSLPMVGLRYTHGAYIAQAGALTVLDDLVASLSGDVAKTLLPNRSTEAKTNKFSPEQIRSILAREIPASFQIARGDERFVTAGDLAGLSRSPGLLYSVFMPLGNAELAPLKLEFVGTTLMARQNERGTEISLMAISSVIADTPPCVLIIRDYADPQA